MKKSTEASIKLLAYQVNLQTQTEMFYLSLCYHDIHLAFEEMKSFKDLEKAIKSITFDKGELQLLHESQYLLEKPFDQVKKYYEEITK